MTRSEIVMGALVAVGGALIIHLAIDIPGQAIGVFLFSLGIVTFGLGVSDYAD